MRVNGPRAPCTASRCRPGPVPWRSSSTLTTMTSTRCTCEPGELTVCAQPAGFRGQGLAATGRCAKRAGGRRTAATPEWRTSCEQPPRNPGSSTTSAPSSTPEACSPGAAYGSSSCHRRSGPARRPRHESASLPGTTHSLSGRSRPGRQPRSHPGAARTPRTSTTATNAVPLAVSRRNVRTVARAISNGPDVRTSCTPNCSANPGVFNVDHPRRSKPPASRTLRRPRLEPSTATPSTSFHDQVRRLHRRRRRAQRIRRHRPELLVLRERQRKGPHHEPGRRRTLNRVRVQRGEHRRAAHRLI